MQGERGERAGGLFGGRGPVVGEAEIKGGGGAQYEEEPGAEPGDGEGLPPEGWGYF